MRMIHCAWLRPVNLKSFPISTGQSVVDCGAIDGREVRPGTISAACGRAGYIYQQYVIVTSRSAGG